MKRTIFLAVLAACILLLGTVAAFGAGGGDITFSPPNVDPIVFSHEMHTKYRGVRCLACHFDRFAVGQGGYSIRKEKLNKRDFCNHCHNGMKAFDSESAGNCTRCHKK